MIEMILTRDSLVEALAALAQANIDEAAGVRNLEHHLARTTGTANRGRRQSIERQLAGHRAIRERQNVALAELRLALAATPPVDPSCAGCARPLLVPEGTDPTDTSAWCVRCGGTASPLPHRGVS